MIILIKRWDTAEIIHSGDFESTKECLEDGVEKGINFYRAELNDAELIGAELSSSNLNNAKLNSANLFGANLISANLIGTNLIDANLAGANLSHAKLDNADLTNADLTNAELTNVELNSAKLNDTNFDFTAWPLWCGTLNIKWADRIFSQLLYHLCSGDHSSLNSEQQKLIFELKQNPLTSKFCDYRNRLPKLNNQ